VTAWRDLFGVEPTRDSKRIDRWIDQGNYLAVVLNDLPADGPVHPAVQYLYPDRLVTICETTGRMLVSVPTTGNRDALAQEVAAVVAEWGCTYMVLLSGEAVA
jgi:hypothetical protein